MPGIACGSRIYWNDSLRFLILLDAFSRATCFSLEASVGWDNKQEKRKNEEVGVQEERNTHYTIQSTVSKNVEFNWVLEFTVRCTEHDAHNNAVGNGKIVAELNGFVCDPGYLPGTEGYDATFDVFDSRSGHAAEAFDVIADNLKLIDTRLGQADFNLECTGIVVLERGFVSPEHRGSRLLLRLMREVRHIMSTPVRMAILKSHPDGDHSSDEDCRKLARYYASDSDLSLIELDSKNLVGWMVADWSEPAVLGADSSVWSFREVTAFPAEA
ncbi:hypothetical protein ACEWPL_004405 [Roseovarius sp. S1116L3]|uniref:hypothetical protein n=1 Tax=Roseovarius roseus TaxID=3342636 RepID=UPI00372CC2B8